MNREHQCPTYLVSMHITSFTFTKENHGERNITAATFKNITHLYIEDFFADSITTN